MTEKTNHDKEVEKEVNSEEEELLQSVHQKRKDETQLDLEFDALDQLKNLVEDRLSIENPGKAFDLYYKALGQLKSGFLRGPETKHVRNEIAIYLKEGKIKGADSRMAPNTLKEKAIKHFTAWATSNDSGDAMALFKKFRILNFETYEHYEPIAFPELTLKILLEEQQENHFSD